MRNSRAHPFVLLITVSLIAFGGVSAAAKSERIVSINVCADQLVMLLADRRRIASVSYLALDPTTSAMADSAVGLSINHGLAEEILPLNPDIVIAGAYTARPAVSLLRKLGYAVRELPVASSIGDIRTNIREVADAIGEPDRGERLIADFDRKLPIFEQASNQTRPMAALFWANGYTSGKGTLANSVLERAGFRTLGNELGISGTGLLPLEILLTYDPDLLVLGQIRDNPALASEILRHPALERVFATRPKVTVPDHLWVCGTPFVAQAIARIAAARGEIAE